MYKWKFVATACFWSYTVRVREDFYFNIYGIQEEGEEIKSSCFAQVPGGVGGRAPPAAPVRGSSAGSTSRKSGPYTKTFVIINLVNTGSAYIAS